MRVCVGAARLSLFLLFSMSNRVKQQIISGTGHRVKHSVVFSGWTPTNTLNVRNNTCRFTHTDSGTVQSVTVPDYTFRNG